MEKLLAKLKSPIEIYAFCKKNPKFFIQNRNLVCKNILRTSGYKVPTKYDKVYCIIFKELSNLVNSIEGKNKITKIEHELYLYFDKNLYNKCKEICSDLLIAFLAFNGINISKVPNKRSDEKPLRNINYNKTTKSFQDRSTVRM